MLSPADKNRRTDMEIETWVSPFGYIHALVPNFDKRFKGSMSMGVFAADEWVYAGDWYIDEDAKPEKMDIQKRFSYGSHGWPRVTKQSLRLEKENPSPDRDGLWGQGERNSALSIWTNMPDSGLGVSPALEREAP